MLLLARSLSFLAQTKRLCSFANTNTTVFPLSLFSLRRVWVSGRALYARHDAIPAVGPERGGPFDSFLR
jgi:hypothetical protein